MTKIFLDPGHGGTDPGAVGHGLREKDLVLDIALRIRHILENEYENVQVRMSRSTDVFIALSQRSKLARDWGADGYASIHLNAFTPAANGCETFMHNASSVSGLRNNLHAAILAELRKHGTVTDRGLKSANFAVLRGTYQTMKTALTEALFITNANDAALLKKSSVLDAIARGHAIGFEKEFNLKKKGSTAKSPAPSKPAPKPKPKPATNTSLLRNGSKGSDVKALQERLIALGYALPKFGADSDFGDETEAAVKAFQRDQGISVDGIAGPDTFNRLSSAKKKEEPKPAPKPQPTKNKYTLPSGVLRRGSKGNAVRQLQTALNAANFNVGSVDGDYGPKTQDAVRRFQSVHLPREVDGVYGPNTRRALDKVVN